MLLSSSLCCDRQPDKEHSYHEQTITINVDGEQVDTMFQYSIIRGSDKRNDLQQEK